MTMMNDSRETITKCLQFGFLEVDESKDGGQGAKREPRC
jgi:hypothetical protein